MVGVNVVSMKLYPLLYESRAVDDYFRCICMLACQ